VVKQAKCVAGTSDEPGLPLGARQSETRRDGRFCAMTDAKLLGLIANMACKSPLGPLTKSLRQNGSIWWNTALGL
jgi:hypothetical protein